MSSDFKNKSINWKVTNTSNPNTAGNWRIKNFLVLFSGENLGLFPFLLVQASILRYKKSTGKPELCKFGVQFESLLGGACEEPMYDGLTSLVQSPEPGTRLGRGEQSTHLAHII